MRAARAAPATATSRQPKWHPIHNLFHYEHRREPLLPWQRFLVHRVGNTLLFASAIIAVSLVIGMLGYRWTEGMTWLNAFLNAAMILGGMGPVAPMHTAAGKLFAGIYALYSGLVLVGVAGLLLAPFAHRLMHRLHLECDDDANA